MSAREWTTLEKGLKQRVRALNMFLKDIYHGRDILRANFRGVFATIRAFAPLLKASGDGLIVNISSIAGFTGAGSNLAYVAAKAGWQVDRYADDAVGHMARNEQGRQAITRIVLKPVAHFGGGRVPSAAA